MLLQVFHTPRWARDQREWREVLRGDQRHDGGKDGG